MRAMTINDQKKQQDRFRRRSGQALLLIVVMMGGILFLVTAVAGLLMYYQVEQSNDIANSTVAIFAADAGLEQALHFYFYELDTQDCTVPCTLSTSDLIPTVVFTNGARVEAEIKIFEFPSTNALNNAIKATGRDVGGRTIRTLETNLLLNP